MIKFITLILLVTSTFSQNKINNKMQTTNLEKATFGAGCFWCVEAIFENLNGVVKVESGYSGGNTNNPTYDDVCSGTTNHAEVVQITFNPNIVSFAELVNIFFRTHDPTTLNRQGADVGSQYRSVILYHDNNQKLIAENVKKYVSSAKIWNEKIVTEISPYKIFYKAEDYHQNYYDQNKNAPYCQIVINPKLEKFKKEFSGKLSGRKE